MEIKSRDLLSRGYFPNELPQAFTTADFGDKSNKLFSSAQRISLGKSVGPSECVYYSIPKAGKSRRILGIPNPLHYSLLTDSLEAHSALIESHLKSRLSCSLPVEDSIRAFQKEKTFGDFLKDCFYRSAEATYELKIDISRYYASIYTHVIAWVLHTKNVAKRQKQNQNLEGNIIDFNTRNLQSGQTMGIPIGPDASLILAELISCYLDDHLLRNFRGLRGARYIDDYYLYFSNKNDAERVQQFIHNLLSEHLLGINEEKTHIKEFPFNIDPTWVISLRLLQTTCFKDQSELEQESDLKQFFSAAFDLAEKNPKEEVMKFAVKSISGLTLFPSNWKYFEMWLFKIGLYDPYTLPEIFAILFKYRTSVTRQELRKFIIELINRNFGKRRSFELAWSLWIAKIFRIGIPNSLAARLFTSSDVIPTLIALDLRAEGLISKVVSVAHLTIDLTQDALNDSRWLLAYEAYIKGWLKPMKANDDFVKTHPYFGRLAKLGISFYDPNVIPPSEEEISRDEENDIFDRIFWGGSYSL